jgi:hypothetical protein
MGALTHDDNLLPRLGFGEEPVNLSVRRRDRTYPILRVLQQRAIAITMVVETEEGARILKIVCIFYNINSDVYQNPFIVSEGL